MKLCFLANGSHVNTKEWVSYFANELEHDVSLISFNPVNEKLKNHLERINTELARYGIIQRDNPGFFISNLKKKKESPYSRVDIRKNKASLDLKLEELQEQIRNLDSISKVRTTLITSKPGKKLRDTTFSYPLGKGWPIASSDLRLKKQVHQAERQLRDIESFRGKRRELRFRKRI